MQVNLANLGISIFADAHYSDGASGDQVDAMITTTALVDASPRAIIDAVVDEVLAQQPTGYDIHRRDMVVTSLERG
jgi:hypothetical protein